jgi:hypothetical protein
MPVMPLICINSEQARAALGLLTKQVINSFISILNNFNDKSSASFPPIYRSELSFYSPFWLY